MVSNHLLDIFGTFQSFTKYGPLDVYLSQKYFKEYETKPNHLKKHDFPYIDMSEIRFYFVGKDGHRQMMKIDATESWKS